MNSNSPNIKKSSIVITIDVFDLIVINFLCDEYFHCDQEVFMFNAKIVQRKLWIDSWTFSCFFW